MVPQLPEQHALWFLHRLDPASTTYHITAAARLHGRLEIAAFHRACQGVVDRHAALRTAFVEHDGVAVQQVRAATEVAFAIEEVGDADDDELRARASACARAPFDLATGPLVRFTLLRRGPDDHLYVFAAHHLAVDMGSMSVILDELDARYRAACAGTEPELPRLRASQLDYVLRQQARLTQDRDRHADFWSSALRGHPLEVLLPTDRARGPLPAPHGAAHRASLGPALRAAVLAHARGANVTPYVVCLAAYQVLLARLTSQDRFAVVSPTTGRDSIALARTVGYFANLIAIPADVPAHLPFAELVTRVGQASRRALEHRDYPFPWVLEALRAPGEPHLPHADVSFTFERPRARWMVSLAAGAGASTTIFGLVADPVAIERPAPQVDLALSVIDDGDDLRLLFDYDPSIFDAATIARFAGCYRLLLEAGLADPRRAVGQLPVLDEASRRRILVDWNDTARPFDQHATLDGAIASQAARTPDTLAVVTDAGQLTYAELDAGANRLANLIRSRGVGAGALVAICLERRLELITSIVGVLRAGAAYVPLDPGGQPRRLAAQIRDAGAALVITQDSLDRDRAELADQPSTPPAVVADAAGPAYVIYTSGTTGQPKGIVCAHRGVINLLDDLDRRAPLAAGDATSLFSSVAFDVSVYELFSALRVGATLHLVPDAARADPAALIDWIERRQIRSAFVPAFALHELAARLATRGTPLRRLLVGVEPIPERLLAEIARAEPRLRVINGYGPTETTVCSTLHEIDPAATDLHRHAPIGRPVQNLRAYVLDARHQPVPVGVIGELYIAGVGLAIGYHKRASITAERFVADPFDERSESAGVGALPARMYRTGDQVRWLPDGSLLFVGRSDHQVKIRGHRVELGEIEATLVEHPAVREAAVVARDDDRTGRRLIAYVGALAPEAIRADALQAFLAERLPPYMQPSAYVITAGLPRNASDKIDRRALPAPPPPGDPTAVFVPPADDLEARIAAIYGDVLGASRVGAEDDFFLLGGHSLLATLIISRIRRELGVELPVRAIFDTPRVRQLAARIAALGDGADPIPPLIAGPRDAPAPLSFAQERLWFLHQLDPTSTAYHLFDAIRLRGALDADAFAAALSAVVARHDVLRTSFAEVDGAAVARVGAAGPVPVPVHDLRDEPEVEQLAELRDLIAAEQGRPFDLTRGPLLRATLLRFADDEHVLLLAIHHLVVDGWSLGILERELHIGYRAVVRGLPIPLPTLAIQYADHARWQRATLSDLRIERSLGFWRQTLADLPPPLELPVSRLDRDGDVAGRAEVTVAARTVTRLVALGRDQRASLFMILVAALDTVLHRWTGRDDLVIGTPIAARSRIETEELIGLFLDTLALRVRLDGEPTFQQLVDRVREVVLRAEAHREVPFERVVAALNPDRDLDRTPIFEVVLNLVSVPGAAATVTDLAFERIEVAELAPKFTLTLYAEPRGDALRLVLVHRRDRLGSAWAEELLAQLASLLDQVALDPDRPIAAYSLITAAARRALPDPAAGLDASPALSLAAQLLAVDGDAEAVRHRGRAWRHRELAAAGRRVAAALAATAPGDVVAVTGERSFGLVAAMVGVLGARRVLLLVDPDLPAARRRQMLEHAGARLILAVDRGGADLADLAEVRPIASDAPLHGLAEAELVPAADDDPAYVFFTSGTTGTPRAVVGRHGGLAHFIAWQRETFAIGPGDRAAQLTGLSFDVVLRDVLTALAAGATLSIPDDPRALSPRELLPWLDREGITLLHTVPTLAATWLDDLPAGSSLASLRWVFIAGEPLTEGLVRRWRARLPSSRARLVNLYGPTETTLAKCFRVIGDEPDPGVQPVGRAMPGAQALVLGPALRPCGVGELGEIVIRTPFRTAGYLHDPEENARRFVANPHAAAPASGATADLLYRTGDLGRFRPDGILEIRGRLDHQVKIAGTRVEPDEVAAVLAGHPQVRAAAVIAARHPRGHLALVAYAVTDAPVGELVAHLARHLPTAMIPSTFVRLEQLPTTGNGKLDRRALPPPDWAIASAGTAPRSDGEREVAALWAELLGVDTVGVDDNYFGLGGHSLLAMRLVAEAGRRFAVTIPVRRLFEAPTVAGMAAAIEELRAAGPTPKSAPDPSAPIVDRGRPFPLTDLQAAFLVGRDRDVALGGVPTQGYVELEVPTRDLAVLERALNGAIARHDMLRAVMTADGLQQVLPTASVTIELRDLAGLDDDGARAAIAATRDELAGRALPLDRAPLLRVVASLRGDTARVHLVIDALIMDVWSSRLLAAEVARRLADPELALPPLTTSFADYVHADLALRDAPERRRARSYWRERLADLPAAPELPLARDAARAAPHFARRRAHLDAAAWRALKARAAAAHLTPSTVLLTVYAEVLALFARTPHFTLNVTAFNRHPIHPQVQELIGNFTSLTLLEVDHRPVLTLIERAHRLQDQLWRDLDHAQFSGVQVLRELARAGRDAPMPFVFTSALGMAEDRQAAAFPEPVDGVTHSAQVLLNHGVAERGGALELRWDTIDAAFPPGLVDEMFAAYRLFVRALARDDGAWHGTSARRYLRDAPPALDARHNITARPIAPDLLHQLFEARALATPDHPAVIATGRRLGYGELRARAGGVADLLRARGIGRGELVAVVMAKGWEQSVAVLGTVAAGAAYLPIDPGLPEERIRYLLGDGRIRVALTQPAVAARRWPDGVEPIVVEAVAPAPAGRAIAPGVAVDPGDLAYVIYTSGSTGQPKGVMIDHRGAVNTILDVNRRFRIDRDDRVLAVSSLSFDLSVFDVFGTLAAGATIVVPDAAAEREPAHLSGCVADHRVTVWNTVPALLDMVVADATDAPARLRSLRLAMMSGDWLPVALPDRLRALVPGIEVVSLGGATEASIWSVAYPIGAVDPGWPSIPYGLPMDNQTIHVLDHGLEPRPLWAVGELYIGGIGVALGYWADDERTRQRFLAHPRLGRIYKTGDLGRRLPDGNVELLGRDDAQVKVRGYRIELGEIEAALGQDEAVRETAVAVLGQGADRRLVGYVVPRSMPAPIEAIRARLAARLPAYMVPADLVVLDALPLTGNGKLDRRRLPAPGRTQRRGGAAPQGEAELALAAIWRELLGVEIAADADLLGLGGDSIIAVQVVSRARRAGLTVTVRQLLGRATLAEIAATAAATVTAAIVDDATGELQLLPIQRWFFDQELAAPHHWNQAMVLALVRAVPAAAIRDAVAALLRHHDALRLRFTREAGGWRQRYLPPDDGEPPFDRVDLGGLDDAAQDRAVADLAAHRQASLDLGAGPLVRVTLIERGTRPPRLLIVIHHLVVDGISWRILAEDLDGLLAGRPLPARTASLGRWAERLTELAPALASAAAIERWRSLPWHRVAALPVDLPDGGNLVAAARRAQVVLDPAATATLLRELPAATGTRVDDVLLAALLIAVTDWSGADVMLVAREGHGRALRIDDVDVTRTVGWLTSLAPVVLERPVGATAAAVLAAVAEQLRRHPDVGIEWGVLRYLAGAEVADRLAALPRPQISFDYLGQADRVLAADATLAWTGEDAGPTRSPVGRRRDLLEVIGFVADGRLQLAITYGADVHTEATARRLAAGLEAALRALVAIAPRDHQTTDVHPISPLQATMLAHHVAPTRPGAYHVQLAFALDGRLERDALAAAWQDVVDHHDALRSGFDDGAQRIHRGVSVRLEHHDLRETPADQQPAALARLRADDAARGFDPAVPPLCRLSAIQTAPERHHLLWSHHHLILDGWSEPIVLADLFAAYAARRAGTTPALPARPGLRELRDAPARPPAAIAARSPNACRLPAPIAGELAGSGDGHLRARLGAAATAALHELARAERVTTSVAVQAAWALALAAGRDETLFGMTVAGREATVPGIEAVVGMLIGVVPVHVVIDRERSVSSWLAELQRGHLERVEVAAGDPGDIEANLRFQNFPTAVTLDGELRFDGGAHRLRPDHLDALDVWHFPLNVVLVPGDELDIRLDHARDRIGDRAAAALLARFVRRLEQLPGDPQRRVADVDE